MISKLLPFDIILDTAKYEAMGGGGGFQATPPR